jgi:HD-like signal output (HDOD) protein
MSNATLPPPSRVIDQTTLLHLADSMSASSQVLLKLNRLMQSPLTTIDDISRAVQLDPALTARVVRISNSAFFATRARSKSLEESLKRVGVREVFRIVTTAAMGNLIPGHLRSYGITGQVFLRASLFSATSSQLLADHAGLDGASAYLAGLMRPIGVLVLNRFGETNFDNVDSLSCDTASSLEGWEKLHFGMSHSEVSACALSNWEFSETVIRSIVDYPGPATQDPLSLVLKASGALAVTSHATLHPRDHDHTLSKSELSQLGIRASALPEISLKALRASRSLEFCS